MKLLEIIKSKRGHNEIDYLFKISPKELKVIKKMMLNTPRLKESTGLKEAHISIRKCMGKLSALET